MKNAYVIYRINFDTEAEIYVNAEQNMRSTIIEVTDDPAEAMQFATAREAYDWARMRNLDFWRVGAR